MINKEEILELLDGISAMVYKINSINNIDKKIEKAILCQQVIKDIDIVKGYIEG